MRKIAQIKNVDAIEEIENADAIEAARVGGWRVVTKKGRFMENEPALFLEVDSFLPEGVPEFSEFVARSARNAVSPLTNETVRGHVLKTIKLRGVISQGVLMKPRELGLAVTSTQDEVDARMETLGVFKWEPPLPAGGQAVGTFPNAARKTDSERVQNLTDEFLESLNLSEWIATEKIDGTSSTFVMTEEGLVTASRNWRVGKDSLQGAMAERLEFEKVLPVGTVVQGEIFGEGIQGNPLKISGTRLAVFFAEMPSETSPEVMKLLASLSVPSLDWEVPASVDEALEQVNGMKSTLNPKVLAEGVVWWNRFGTSFEELGDRANFKAINNKFLLKLKE